MSWAGFKEIEMDDFEIAMRELRRIPTKKQGETQKKYTPPFSLLTVDEVSEAIRLSRGTIYRMIDKASPYFDATFPEPLKVSGRTMWRADEITAWMLGLKRGVGQPVKTNTKPPNAK